MSTSECQNPVPDEAAADSRAEELRIALEHARELADELEYIKRSPAFRQGIRLRSSGLWNAIRWLRNRNRGVVVVRALGTHGASSAGNEVALLEARPNPAESPIPWQFLEQDSTWKEQPFGAGAYGRCLASAGGRLRIPVDKDPELRFRKHARAGQVEICFRGRREVLDLHSPDEGVLRVYPARDAMLLAGQRTAAPDGNSRMAADAARDEAFIAGVKRGGGGVVAVHCPRWLGVTSSTRALFRHTYPVPATPQDDPYSATDGAIARHAEVLAATGAEHVVISGGDECHVRLAARLHELNPRIRVDLLWHGSYAHFQEDYGWQMLKQWMALSREGVIHTIAVVKKGMESFLRAHGVRAAFVMNYLDEPLEPSPAIQADGKHLGLWLSGVNRMKVPYPMLAAVKMVPDGRLHSAGLDERCRDVISEFRIPVALFEPRPLPHGKLLDAIRRTHLSLYVTFSECCPMLPLESLRVGVPCLIGPNSHLFEDSPYLFERLVVPFPDRADVIARYIERAVSEREEIVQEYARYMPEYNARARESVEAFLKG